MSVALQAAIGVLFLLGAAVSYQAVATFLSVRKYSPPGERVDIGGYRLHVQRAGRGTPTVVFDAGAGGWSVDWSLVAPQVAAFAQVVTYDRAGYGWSDAGPRPRDADQCVHELDMLLTRSGIAGPYILVGHSIGGLHAQLYAHRYPEKTQGVILVDATDCLPIEEQLAYLAAEEQTLGRRNYHKYLLPPRPGVHYYLSRSILPATGIFRLMGRWFAGLLPPYSVLPVESQATYRALLFQPKWLRTYIDEGAMVEQSRAQVHRAGTLPDHIRLTAIKGKVEGGRRYDQPPFEPIQMFQKMRQAMQEELASSVPRGKFILAAQSAHYVHIDQPEVVVAAIREMVESALTQ